ncbi:hypothetical protein [Acinetobacter vivianii]|uniref:hypothetical protein n=1 Tax=Acinetobacter vivianii TaxID=1776742 RepID=UPI002DBA5FA9|nr:hypothetical protein [Acinetobacter vivianii]MEB6480699.1 hypothetical protein [Acinetobacter vivianii]MEB6658983.1 hypothetical protein [Acinetobacter vivianii]
MTFKQVFALLTAIPLGLAGCAGIGPNATYNMATTSFHYDLSYNAYMVELNSKEIGGGFGGGTNVAPIKVGQQVITWKDSHTGKLHRAKNAVVITKDQLKGKKYLAAHLYPDDTVEITTSNDLPDPTRKGLEWMDKQRSQGVKQGSK